METKRSASEKRINTNHTTALMKINRYIDHTLLSPTATPDDIVKLCEEAIEHDFYAVCVNGCYVDLAKRVLRESNVKIASVVGFPLGASSVEAKIKEARSEERRVGKESRTGGEEEEESDRTQE